VEPPATGAAGQAGSGAVAPPATGAAGQAGSGAAGQPVGGGAGPVVGGAAGTTAPPATSAAATIVPLYTSPGDPSWNTVIAAKAAHPTVGVVAIVNPSNGPGSAVSSAYASGIARLTAAGIKVIGYVSTDYTRNSAATVKADIDRWRAFYPGQLTGIFFDEQSNQADDVAYYRDLSQYAKAQGLSFTVGNPGTDTAEAFVGSMDMMLIYESAGLPSIDRLAGWHAKHAPSNFGVIPHAASMSTTFVRDARKYVQYIYLQNDTLPNPWDSVPSYFDALLAALE
jgi:Spherulation-specific family 4